MKQNQCIILKKQHPQITISRKISYFLRKTILHDFDESKTSSVKSVVYF